MIGIDFAAPGGVQLNPVQLWAWRRASSGRRRIGPEDLGPDIQRAVAAEAKRQNRLARNRRRS